MYTMKSFSKSIITRLASHFVPLQASPAGLLGRFAPSALCASRSHSLSLRSLKIFKKKCVLINSKWHGLKRIKIQNFTPMTRFARSAASAASSEVQPYLPLWSLRSLGLRASRSYSQSLRSLGLRASRSLPTPWHSKGPKECPCQVSWRSDQNYGR